MTTTPGPPATREFVINPYLAVRLEGHETVIYVGGRRFRQCKALVMNIPASDFYNSSSPGSIDELGTRFHKYEQTGLTESSDKIPPEVEFWGHCSNLQAWADHDYDTRLLHSNLAFPLLKALADAGDPSARVALGREVAARFATGYMPVVNFLVEGQYYRYLTAADLDLIPPDVLIELYGTGAYDLNPEAFKQVRSLPPTVTLSGKRYVIRNGKLDASNRHVTDAELNESLKLKDQIKSLNLSGNWLRSIPDALGNLASLTNLDLSHNQLRALPDALGNLASLTNLDLSHNQLRALPDALGNLASLKRLDLSHNQLRDLPGGLGKLTSLRFLRLWENRLQTLPDALGNLPAIQSLELGINQLRDIPSALGKLTSLVVLGLRDNQLRTLPDVFGNLASLQELDLSGNQLRTLPDWIIHTKLEFVRLSRNERMELSPAVRSWIKEMYSKKPAFSWIKKLAAESREVNPNG